MNHNARSPRQQPRAPTDHKRTPALAPQKKKMVAASPIVQSARSVERHENRVIDPKNGGYSQALATCIGVAVLRVAF